MALIDKLLNPLKEVQEAIDRSLSKGDDLATFAAQFNTTAGRLAKVQALGEASGLDAEGLRMLLVKFQTSLAEAAADKNKDTSVRAFAGRQDTLEAFFEFIQSLQKLNKGDQLRVQSEVFGERQILKASEFLNADFATLGKQFARFDTEKLTRAANKLANFSDLNDRLGTTRRRAREPHPARGGRLLPHLRAGPAGADAAAAVDRRGPRRGQAAAGHRR